MRVSYLVLVLKKNYYTTEKDGIYWPRVASERSEEATRGQHCPFFEVI